MDDELWRYFISFYFILCHPSFHLLDYRYNSFCFWGLHLDEIIVMLGWLGVGFLLWLAR